MTIQAYECWPNAEPTWKSVVYAKTPGKAKSEYWSDVSESWDIPYTSIRCRALPNLVSQFNVSAKAFARNAKYRQIPFAYLGMTVEVDGKKGIIVGHNDSANLNILFEDGNVLNCHPWWQIKYFDLDGNVIKEFKDGYEELK